MKIARTIGLAAIAATAFMASVGASSAIGAETTLCKTGGESPYCESKNRYPAETALETSSSTFKINTELLTISCESTLKGKVDAESGKPLPVTVSAWTFTKCGINKAMTNCPSTTIKNLPFAGSLSRTTGWNGVMTVGAGGSGEPRLYAHCLSFLDCEWALEPSISVEGGNPAHLAVTSGKLTPVGGYLCPEEASIEAAYAISSPGGAWVARAESPPAPTTGLCKEFESPCEQVHLYPKGTKIAATSNNLVIDIDNEVGDYVCSGSSLEAETTAASGEPLPITNSSFSLGTCKLGNLSGTCTANTEALYTGSLSRTPLTASGAWKGGGAKWRLKCGAYIQCTYSIPSNSTLTLEGGNPAVIRAKEVKLNIAEEGGVLCGTKAYLSADFTLSSPKPVWVTDVVPAT